MSCSDGNLGKKQEGLKEDWSEPHPPWGTSGEESSLSPRAPEQGQSLKQQEQQPQNHSNPEGLSRAVATEAKGEPLPSP